MSDAQARHIQQQLRYRGWSLSEILQQGGKARDDDTDDQRRREQTDNRQQERVREGLTQARSQLDLPFEGRSHLLESLINPTPALRCFQHSLSCA